MQFAPRSIDRTTAGLLVFSALLFAAAGVKLFRHGSIPARTTAMVQRGALLDAWAAKWRAQEIDPAIFYRLASDGPRIGIRDPDVTIVVFMNFACGHCAVLDKTLERLLERYPDHLAVVFRHFVPTMERGILKVHLAAECAADQGKYPEFHREAFENPTLIDTREGWRRLGEVAGVPDLARFAGCTLGETDRARIAQADKIGENLGVVGTPTSFVNGIRVVGEAPFETLDSLVAFQLDRLRPKPGG